MSQNKEEIIKEVKNILVDLLSISIDEITPNASLSDELGLDSFGAVELGFAVKDKFGVEISEEDFPKIKTVEDLVNFIEKIRRSKDDR